MYKCHHATKDECGTDQERVTFQSTARVYSTVDNGTITKLNLIRSILIVCLVLVLLIINYTPT